jgi:methylmalonyl-CoA/ethylmalonyl-CoA epimerase
VLKRIHHIGVAVRQMEHALHFYRDRVGLPVTRDAVLEEQGIRGVLLSAGETEIELLEPLRPDEPVGRFLAQRGEGLHHLCFETDDIEAELSLARSRGLPLVDERPRPGLAGLIAFLHPRAARGVLVEYAQPPDQLAAGGVAPHPTGLVRRFDHVAVAVTDLDAGVGIYRDNFGLVEEQRRDVPPLGIRAATLPIGQSWIEVVTPMAGDGALGPLLQSRGEGLYLLSLAVPALETAMGAMAAWGAQVTGPVTADGGVRVAFISPESACGVLIELVERDVAA